MPDAQRQFKGDRNIAPLIKISTLAPVNARSLKSLVKVNCAPNGLVIRGFNFELQLGEISLSSPSQVAKFESEGGKFLRVTGSLVMTRRLRKSHL